MKPIGKKRKKKIGKKKIATLWTALSYIYLGVLFLFIFVSLIGRFTLFQSYGKIQLRTVISGSMEPTIPVGSLILTKKTAADQVSVGDVITFESAGEQVTHRVISIKDKKIYTQGDANTVSDEGTAQENLEKVYFWLPKIGAFFLLIQTTQGTMALLATILTLLLAVQFIQLLFLEPKSKKIRYRRKRHAKKMVT